MQYPSNHFICLSSAPSDWMEGDLNVRFISASIQSTNEGQNHVPTPHTKNVLVDNLFLSDESQYGMKYLLLMSVTTLNKMIPKICLPTGRLGTSH